MPNHIGALLSLTLASLAVAAAFVTPSAPLIRSRSHSPLKAVDGTDVDFPPLDGTGIRVGIIRTRWNNNHVENLVSGIRTALAECNVTDADIFETEVPGSFELPFAARLLALSKTVDAVICTGVLVKGDTLHFEYICDSVSSGIMTVGLQTTIPTIFGVLTCLTEEQVISRSTGDNNHGEGWGKTAVEMALLRRDAFGVSSATKKMGFGISEPLQGNDKKKAEGLGFF